LEKAEKERLQLFSGQLARNIMLSLREMRIKRKENYTDITCRNNNFMTKKIPKFKSLEEEAAFWDTHSFADYWDEGKMIDLDFSPGPKRAVIHVKVAKSLKDRIEEISKAKHISVSSLIRMWTVEKLKQLS
jgi:hypothetical protein